MPNDSDKRELSRQKAIQLCRNIIETIGKCQAFCGRIIVELNVHAGVVRDAKSQEPEELLGLRTGPRAAFVNADVAMRRCEHVIRQVTSGSPFFGKVFITIDASDGCVRKLKISNQQTFAMNTNEELQPYLVILES